MPKKKTPLALDPYDIYEEAKPVKPVRPMRSAKPVSRRPAYQSSGSAAGSIAMVIIIILIIAGAIGAVYYLTNYRSATGNDLASGDNNQIPLGVNVPSDQTQQTPPAQTDPAADWKTYDFALSKTKASSSTTSTSLFAFKYPSGLSVERTGDVVRLTSSVATDTQIFVYYETTKKDLTGYLKDLDTASAKAWEGQPSIKVVTSTAGTLGGNPMVLREQKMLAADLNSYTAYILSQGKVYTVSLAAPALSQELAQFFLVFLNNFKLQN